MNEPVNMQNWQYIQYG